MTEELQSIKSTIRAVLVSSPHRLTINNLRHEYKILENQDIPYRKFHFRSTYDFFMSMPDTVRLLQPGNYDSLIEPVMNEKTEHVRKLVQQQKPSRKSHALPPRFAGSRHSQSRAKHFQLPKPVLHIDCRKEIFRLLQSNPKGISRDEFDSHVQRILMNYNLHFETEEVINNINDFITSQGSRVFLKQESNHNQLRRNSEGSILTISSDNSDIDEYENGNCVSALRPQSGDALKVNEGNENDTCFVSENLIRNLRTLLEDNEHNGIWLTKLTHKYKHKFGYPLSPREHGFTDVLDMVANLPSVFKMKQYRMEGDHLLSDARKFTKGSKNCRNGEGNIPQSIIEELKKMLKNKEISTSDLLSEYERTYQKHLPYNQFGFANFDSFLQHLESSCKELLFRKIRDETVIKLNYVATDVVNSRRSSCAPLPVYGDVTFDPFPPEVCNADFQLEADTFFDEVKKGDVFPINLGEVFTPGKFYITHISKVDLREEMMIDLQEFYEHNEQKYKVLAPLISRNLLCACLYSSNSQWHRVRVSSVSIKTAKIFYIDYGTSDDVSTEKLRYLHKDFARYPPLCIQAKLSGIQPKDGGTYSPEVCKQFLRLFGNCDLEAEVIDIASKYLEVHLWASIGEDRVSVHRQLILKNLVEKKKVKQNTSKATEMRSNKSPASLLATNLPPVSSTASETLGANRCKQMADVESLPSRIEGTPKPPPGFSQPVKSLFPLLESHQNQRFAEVPVSHQTMNDPLYGPTTAYYTPYPYMAPTFARPAYVCSYPNVYLPSAYSNLPMPHNIQYQNITYQNQFQANQKSITSSSFRPPPGIRTLPTSLGLTVPKIPSMEASAHPNMSTSFQKLSVDTKKEMNFPDPAMLSAYTTENSKSLGNGLLEIVSSEIGSYPSSTNSDVVAQHLGEHLHSICPSDYKKSVIECNPDLDTIPMKELKQRLDEMQASREREALENKLEEYFSSKVSNKNKPEFLHSNAQEMNKTTRLWKTDNYTCEFEPKCKPAKTNRKVASEFEVSSLPVLMPVNKKSENLNPIRAFVLKQMKEK